MPEVDLQGPGRKPRVRQVRGSNPTWHVEPSEPREPELIERMLGRENMLKALQAVEANQGAAGVDGLEVGELRAYLRGHWAVIKEQILNGSYEPGPCGGWTSRNLEEGPACWESRRSSTV